MGNKHSNYYTFYRFNDGSSYKVEIGKDGVTEEDMRNLRRVIKSQDKLNSKMAKLDVVSIEATVFDIDEQLGLIDYNADVELIIENIEMNETLRYAFTFLNTYQKKIVRKKFYENKSTRAIATELGISQPAVIKHLSKVKKILKKYF